MQPKVQPLRTLEFVLILKYIVRKQLGNMRIIYRICFEINRSVQVPFHGAGVVACRIHRYIASPSKGVRKRMWSFQICIVIHESWSGTSGQSLKVLYIINII
jgi:hypothetical protein